MILTIWVKHMNRKTNKLEKITITLLFIILTIIGLYFNKENQIENTVNNTENPYKISNIPSYNGEIYIELNNNIPNFSEEDKNIVEDHYSNLENEKVRKSSNKN